MFSDEIKQEIEPIKTWYFVGEKINVQDYDLNVLNCASLVLLKQERRRMPSFNNQHFQKE